MGLEQALLAVVEQATPCSYTVPAPVSDYPLDPSRITLDYFDDNTVSRTLRAATSGACQDGEWYVSASDALGFPVQVTVCPSLCQSVKPATGATLTLMFQSLCGDL
jgi:hypothetical protein